MDIKLHYRSARQISEEPLPGPSFVLRMADEESLLAPVRCVDNVMDSRDLLFNDADSDYGLVRSPSKNDAQLILDYFDIAEEMGCPNFVAQCQAGKGRSQAVIAALCRKLGRDNSTLLRHGTYNRKLYDLLLAEMGIANPQPLVSIVVRVKYGVEKLAAFKLSMNRQRYENWELIAVTDGPNQDAEDLRTFLKSPESEFRIIQTPKPLGRWGHPYRQLGIDAARGEYIGLQNCDNYCSPGFVEQLVLAMQIEQADLAACQIVHSYSGWSVTHPGSDLCSWMARADLVKRHPWTGTDAEYEWRYLKELEADGKLAIVDRPLVVKN